MAINANITIDQGATFKSTFILEDASGNIVDLTGFTAASNMKKDYTSKTGYTFDATVEESNGAVILSMSGDVTSDIKPGRYVYDCELISGVTVSKIISGIVTVNPEVAIA